MTPDVVASALDAQALNRAQHRLAWNPDAEVNSLLEHVRELARTATDEQRPHISALLGLIRRLCESNRAELDCERLIAATADGLGERGWSVKRAAHELRDPLAVLASPIIGGARRDSARAEVERIIRACPREVLLDDDAIRESLVNEIRSRKATCLWAVICEVGATA